MIYIIVVAKQRKNTTYSDILIWEQEVEGTV